MLFDENTVLEMRADEIEGLDAAAYEFLHMDEEQVEDMFPDEFEDTRANAMKHLASKAVVGSFRIDEVASDEVRLQGGTTLKSAALAQLIGAADELVMYAIVVHGQKELMECIEDEVIEGMLCEAWAVSMTMCAHGHVKKLIRDRAREQARYVGRSWVPGVNGLEMQLQGRMFDLLDPTRIGIRMLEGYRLSPYLTISGFMGVSDDPQIESAGADLPEGH